MKPSRALRINPGGPHSTHHRMTVKGFASRAGGSCSKEASRHLPVAAAGPTLDIHPVARRLPLTGLMQEFRLCTSMANIYIRHQIELPSWKSTTYHRTGSIRFLREATTIVSIRFSREATGVHNE
jgi:hypothetical protein